MFISIEKCETYSLSKRLNLVEEVLYAHIVCALHGLHDEVDDADTAAVAADDDDNDD